MLILSSNEKVYSMQHSFQLFFLVVVFTSLITLRMILFNQQTKFIITSFSQDDFILSKKVELKENYTKLIFLFERSQTKRKYYVYKEMQLLKT